MPPRFLSFFFFFSFSPFALPSRALVYTQHFPSPCRRPCCYLPGALFPFSSHITSHYACFGLLCISIAILIKFSIDRQSLTSLILLCSVMEPLSQCILYYVYMYKAKTFSLLTLLSLQTQEQTTTAGQCAHGVLSPDPLHIIVQYEGQVFLINQWHQSGRS